MPLAPHPIKQLTTYKVAKSIYDQFAALGVPISDLTEILPTGQIISTEDTDYVDDGSTNQYTATFWGASESVPLAALEVSKLGGFNGFLELATACTGGQLSGVMAILALPGRVALLDKSLPFTSPIKPDKGDDPSVGAGNSINGVNQR